MAVLSPPRSPVEQIRELFLSDAPGALALLGDDPSAGLFDRRPILLLEASEILMVEDPTSGRLVEVQTELLIQQGFQRLTRSSSPMTEPLRGWTLGITGGELELRGAYGDLWTTVDILPDRVWLDTASTAGQALVLYGVCLGVRAVGSMHFDTKQRTAELRAARRYGLVASAAISWVP